MKKNLIYISILGIIIISILVIGYLFYNHSKELEKIKSLKINQIENNFNSQLQVHTGNLTVIGKWFVPHTTDYDFDVVPTDSNDINSKLCLKIKTGKDSTKYKDKDLFDLKDKDNKNKLNKSKEKVKLAKDNGKDSYCFTCPSGKCQLGTNSTVIEYQNVINYNFGWGQGNVTLSCDGVNDYDIITRYNNQSWKYGANITTGNLNQLYNCVYTIESNKQINSKMFSGTNIIYGENITRQYCDIQNQTCIDVQVPGVTYYDYNYPIFYNYDYSNSSHDEQRYIFLDTSKYDYSNWSWERIDDNTIKYYFTTKYLIDPVIEYNFNSTFQGIKSQAWSCIRGTVSTMPPVGYNICAIPSGNITTQTELDAVDSIFYDTTQSVGGPFYVYVGAEYDLSSYDLNNIQATFNWVGQTTNTTGSMYTYVWNGTGVGGSNQIYVPLNVYGYWTTSISEALTNAQVLQYTNATNKHIEVLFVWNTTIAGQPALRTDFLNLSVYTAPTVNLEAPIPVNNTVVNNTFYVNSSLTLGSTETLNWVNYSFNNTNYTYYDSSLVLFMNFDNRSTLGESNSLVRDLSKYNSTTKWGQGENMTFFKYGTGALNVAGVALNNVTINDSANLNLSQRNWTIQYWEYKTASSSFELVYADWTPVSSIHYGINAAKMSMYLGGLGECASANTVPLNQWNLLTTTLVWNGSGTTCTHYINAVQNGTPLYMASSATYSNSQKTIGTKDDGSFPFNGIIDELYIWNRTLSNSEMVQMYRTRLTKESNTRWILELNQTKNLTAFLDNGTYNFNVCASNNYGTGCNGTTTVYVGTTPPDTTPPTITLINPANATTTPITVNYFIANFTDNVQLKNSTFYIWFINGTLINTTNYNIIGVGNFSNTTYTLSPNYNYSWNYRACDNSSNCQFNITGNFTIIIPENIMPTMSYVSPVNNSNITNSLNWFNVTLADNVQLKNSTFYIWYSNGSIANTTTWNVIGTANSSNSYYTLLSFDRYLWNYKVCDTSNNCAFNTTAGNYTLNYLDGTNPVSSLIKPLDNNMTSSSWSLYNASFTDNVQLKNSTFYIWYSNTSILNTTNFNIIGTSNSSQLNFSFTNSGVYKWNYKVCDNSSLSNCAFDITGNHTITYDNFFPQFSNFLSSPLPNTEYGYNQTYIFNVTILNTNGTVIFQFNNTNYSVTSLGNNNYSAKIYNLPRGGFYYYWYTYGNGTMALFNQTSAINYNILMNSTGYSGMNEYTSNPTTYPNNISINVTEGNLGDADCNYTLLFNNSYVSLNYTRLLAVGSYPWYHSIQTNCMNYSSTQVSSTYVVNQGTPNLILYLNEINNNLTTSNTTVSIISQLLLGEAFHDIEWNAYTYNNSVSQNTTLTYTFIPGYYRIDTAMLSSQNYTAYNTSLYLNVTDSVYPNITLLAPPDKYYTANATVTFAANISDNNYLDHVTLHVYNSVGEVYNKDFFIYNSTPYLMIANFTFNVLGKYYWNIQACDSLQCYFSPNRTLQYIEFPYFSQPIINPVNNSQYTDGQGIDFSTTIIRTNFTAGIQFNGTNYSMSNLNQVFNKTFYGLRPGNYSYYFWAYGQGVDVYNYSSTYSYVININNSDCKIISNVTSPVTYGSKFTINNNCTSQYIMYRNGTDITGQVLQDLSVGSYNFTIRRNDNQNFTNFQNEFDITINKASPNLGMSITGNSPVTYPSSLNVSSSENNTGDADLTYSLNMTNNTYAVGTHVFNYSTAGGQNYTFGSVTYSGIVNSNSSNCNVYFNVTSPITIGSSFIVYTNCTTPYNLYLNGGYISNGTIQTLGPGTYNYTVIRNDNQNYSNYFSESDMTINPDTIYPMFSNNVSYPLNPSTYVYNKSYYFNILVSNSNGTGLIQFNGTNYSLTNISNVYKYSTRDLAAGNYTYKYFFYGNGPSKNLNVSQDYTYTINKAVPLFSIISNSPVTYPSSLTVSSLENNQGDGDLVYSFNMSNGTYNVGTHVFNLSTTGGQNYTFNSTTFSSIVNQNTNTCILSFNESSPITYPSSFEVYPSCSSSYTLYRNGTDITGTTLQSLSSGTYNFTIVRTDNENYSSITDTKYFTVNSGTDNPPQFIGLVDFYWLYNLTLVHQVNAIDDYGISCFTINNTNFNINCSGYLTNATFLSIGSYPVNITVNDTINQRTSKVITISIVSSIPPPVSNGTIQCTLQKFGFNFIEPYDPFGFNMYSVPRLEINYCRGDS